MVREGVVAALPGDELSGLPKLGWRIARLFTRRRALSARPQRPAGRRGRRGSARPTSSSASSWRRGPMWSATTSRSISRMLQDRMATFPTAEAVAAIEGSLGRPIGELYVELRRAGRRRLDRAGASGRGRARRRCRARWRSRSSGRACAGASSSDLESYFLAARLQERYIPSTRRLRPVEVTEDARADDQDRDGSAARGGGAFGARREHAATIPASACRAVDWERTGRDVLTMEWIDGIKMNDVEALARRRPRSQGDRRQL